MGFWNPRAICPSCRGKIHTQSFGAERWTGPTCQWCDELLTGRVIGNRAELRAPGAPPLGGPGAAPQPIGLFSKVVGGFLVLVLVVFGATQLFKGCGGRSEYCGGPVYIDGVQSDPD